MNSLHLSLNLSDGRLVANRILCTTTCNLEIKASCLHLSNHLLGCRLSSSDIRNQTKSGKESLPSTKFLGKTDFHLLKV